jgi:hypothetical protein
MNAVRHVALVLAAALLAACASVPLSAIMRGASFNETTFGYVDARALRVKVSVPKGFAVDVPGTTLAALVESTRGSRRVKLTLDALSTIEGKRPEGLMRNEVDVTSFEMDLTEESVKSLRELQQLVAQAKVKRVSLEVNVNLAEAPEGATSVKVWIEILISPMEGYFTMIDGGTILLNKAITYGGS